MSKLGNIIEGWYNYINPDPAVEVIAEARANICVECPKANISTALKVLPGLGITDKAALCCSICHCPIISKARAMAEECPLNKWPVNN